VNHSGPPKRPNLDVMTKPIFRYFHPTWADILENRQIRMSRACDCNDPFEMMPRYDQVIRREVESVSDVNFAFTDPHAGPSWEEFKQHKQEILPLLMEECLAVWPKKFQKEFSERYGILCFAEKIDNLLMWAHYADSHKGFALEFDPTDSFFSPQEFGQVKYEKSRPDVDDKDYTKILLRKSEDWKYEDEWRLIKDLQSRGQDPNRYFLPFPVMALRGVYLGYRLLDANRKKLLDALPKLGADRVRIFEMHVDPVNYRMLPVLFGSKPDVPSEAYKVRDALWNSVFLGHDSSPQR
jgi:hypothetical protein